MGYNDLIIIIIIMADQLTRKRVLDDNYCTYGRCKMMMWGCK